MSLGGKPVRDPAPFPAARGLANRFACPAGRDVGRGHLLLLRQDLLALDGDALHPLVIAQDVSGVKYEVTLPGLLIVDAQCVSPGYSGDPDSTYLVEVADRRHLLHKRVIDKAYNLRIAPGQGAAAVTRASSQPWTWDELLRDLWEHAGLDDVTAWPGLGFTPPAEGPQNLAFWMRPAWDALNDVLDLLGAVLVYDPVTDAFRVAQLGLEDLDLAEALLEAEAQGLRQWDDDTLEFRKARYPETVRVIFPRQGPRPEGTSPWKAVDKETAVVGAEAGSVVILEDTLLAWEADANAAQLDARAEERKEDYLRSLQGGVPMLLAFHAPLATVLPGARVAAVAWEDLGRGLRTTVLRRTPGPGGPSAPPPADRGAVVRVPDQSPDGTGFFAANSRRWDEEGGAWHDVEAGLVLTLPDEHALARVVGAKNGQPVWASFGPCAFPKGATDCVCTDTLVFKDDCTKCLVEVTLPAPLKFKVCVKCPRGVSGGNPSPGG